jgi:hypothetical protein
LAKILAFFVQTSARFSKHLIITFFRKTPIFAENWQKTQKIVIITSTPGHTGYIAHESFARNVTAKENVT